MGKTIHCHLSVRGALGWGNRLLKGLFKRDDGTLLSADEARAYLMDCLASGKEALSFGKPCEGFNDKTGCPGHENEGK